MGQQQLLLLVLATVIVGLATVAGIQAFEQGSKRANQDALTQTAVKIASDVQAQLQEPEPLGGYGIDDMSNYSGGVSLSQMGFTTKSSSNQGLSTPVYRTTDGECAITNDASSDVQVTCESEDSKVVVKVSGLGSQDIETIIQNIKS